MGGRHVATHSSRGNPTKPGGSFVNACMHPCHAIGNVTLAEYTKHPKGTVHHQQHHATTLLSLTSTTTMQSKGHRLRVEFQDACVVSTGRSKQEARKEAITIVFNRHHSCAWPGTARRAGLQRLWWLIVGPLTSQGPHSEPTSVPRHATPRS